jgi:nitrogenase-associated protein
VARIIFYEKPGCKTNARQKNMLASAGHEVVPRNLLAQPWTPEALKAFFGETAPARWFNAAAPAVKSGAVVPGRMEAAAALVLLAANPILIRRPLVEAEGRKCAGFDGALVASLLAGLEPGAAPEACSRAAAVPPEMSL